ncbi:hypothetical protein M758_2G184900 [Ceratodon purpureus]|nr:hypothetical protein M758_2G184900 [Ceratodon purpureus]
MVLHISEDPSMEMQNVSIRLEHNLVSQTLKPHVLSEVSSSMPILSTIVIQTTAFNMDPSHRLLSLDRRGVALGS